MSKFFEDEFLLEVVKSYWLAKCVYVNITSELAIKLKSKSKLCTITLPQSKYSS